MHNDKVVSDMVSEGVLMDHFFIKACFSIGQVDGTSLQGIVHFW